MALLVHALFTRKLQRFPTKKGIALYASLYYMPLFLGVEYIWNRRYLPDLPITDPISLIHSLIIALLVLASAFLSRRLFTLMSSGSLQATKFLVAGFVTCVAAVFYFGMNSFSIEITPIDAPPPSAEKPNVLLITIDTLRADHLGCYGGESILTPTIDSLAAGGVMFKSVTSHVPLTLPSHTSILTSADPPIHGVRDNARYRFENSIPTLAEVFKTAGYATSAFISAFVLDSRFGLDRGFHVYDDNIQNQAYFYFFSTSPPFTLAGGMKLLGLTPPYKPERKADKTTEAAMAWLDENREKRFFMWVHYFDPHGPLNPPSPYDTLYLEPGKNRQEFLDNVERYITLQGQSDSNLLSPEEIEGIRTLYKGEVTFTDHSIGALLDHLRLLGIEDRTLIVVTSDHGQSISEHQYIGHSVELYREILHVPLIFTYPGKIPEGMTVENQVRSIDIMPTVLSMLDIDIPATCRGRDLTSVIRSRPGEDKDPPAYIETLHARPMKKRLVGIVSGDYKYFRALEGNREELYWITSDPEEAENLVMQDIEQATYLRTQLQDMIEGMETYATSREIPLDHETMEAMKALGYIR
jgi:arylsulfatase A-like enzyme